MERRIYFEDNEGNKVCGVLDTPPKAGKGKIVLMAHGLGMDKSSRGNVKIARRINDLGLPTFRIDMYGHGESDGKFVDLTVSHAAESILAAISYLDKRGYRKIAFYGTSFGGIAGIIAASRNKRLSLLILRSPVSDYCAAEDARMSRQKMSEWRQKGEMPYVNAAGKNLRKGFALYEDAKKNNAYMAAPNIKIPVLIVHGKNDEVVPISQSIKTSRLIKDCELHIVKGADHRYSTPKHFDEMLEEIVSFVKKRFKG